MQKQTNYIDCGSLAIAFANCLAHYETPLRWFYDTTKLRQHLISCLEAVKMSVFPTHSTNEKKKDFKATLYAIEIYCLCRMQYNTRKDDDKIESIQVKTI